MHLTVAITMDLVGGFVSTPDGPPSLVGRIAGVPFQFVIEQDGDLGLTVTRMSPMLVDRFHGAPPGQTFKVKYTTFRRMTADEAQQLSTAAFHASTVR